MEINFSHNCKTYNVNDPKFDKLDDIKAFKETKETYQSVNCQVDGLLKNDGRLYLDLNPTKDKVALDCYVHSFPFNGHHVTGVVQKTDSEIEADYKVETSKKNVHVTYEMKDQTEKMIVKDLNRGTTEKIAYNQASGTLTFEQE